MIAIEDYYESFMEGILSSAQAKEEMTPQSFFEIICESLVESGDISINYSYGYFYKTGIEVSGWDYEEDKKQLTLFVCEKFTSENIETLNKSVVDTKLKRVYTFFEKSLMKLYENLEETTDAFQISYNIYEKYIKNEINKVKIVLLTNGRLTKTIKTLESKSIKDIIINYSIIDIEYLYKTALSNFVESDVDIDVNIPCLKVDNSTEYESFLAVIDGETIFNIYDTLGKKVLDENVRTFLQFKGGVNKGIRNTIENKPEYFFAYNNGITATAKEVILNETKNKIIKIKNLKIVNGGQTTSSIYRSKIDSKKDISNIFVQMKLSLVKNTDNYSEFVQKISEYANTQNKVNASDLFSNHEFHKDYSVYSKRVWAPPKLNTINKTRWYYERVRGEYLNDIANERTMAKKDKFKIENPKPQVIDKVLLAKSENLWNMFPVEVSKGAQYSFRKFAETIVADYEKNEQMITELYFKNTVSRVIIFRSLEKIIKNASWYNEYRSQAIAYTISYLAYYLKENKLNFNFLPIWESQDICDELEVMLETLAKKIYRIITNPEVGKNIGEWCKKPACWLTVKESKIEIEFPKAYLIDKNIQQEIVKKAKQAKKEDIKIDYLIEIANIDIENWKTMYIHYDKYRDITPTKLNLISEMAYERFNQGLFYPSDKQAKLLYDVYKQAKKEGVI